MTATWTVRGPDGLQHFPTQVPVSAMKSYSIVAPLRTHWRPASCAEFECPEYLNGWVSVFPADSPQAEYIRHDKSRRHVETRDSAGLATFTFEAGQQYFACDAHDHRLPTGRPERFLERGGDWRGSTGAFREHVRADDWVDSFANNQIKLADRLGRG